MSKQRSVTFSGALFALTIVAAVAIPTGTASADVSQTPVATGCPTGQPLTNIQGLEAAQAIRTCWVRSWIKQVTRTASSVPSRSRMATRRSSVARTAPSSCSVSGTTTSRPS
jgi:hypothetical protein